MTTSANHKDFSPSFWKAMLAALFFVLTLNVAFSLLDNSTLSVHGITKLKARLIAAQATLKDGEQFDSIIDIARMKDDEATVRDLEARRILLEWNYRSLSDEVYAFTKFINESHPDVWFDYSKQNLSNGIYTLPVSTKACELINEALLNKTTAPCFDNIMSIDLSEGAKNLMMNDKA